MPSGEREDLGETGRQGTGERQVCHNVRRGTTGHVLGGGGVLIGGTTNIRNFEDAKHVFRVCAHVKVDGEIVMHVCSQAETRGTITG